MRIDPRAQEGFTILELMYSMAVLGILSISVLAIFKTFRERAYEATLTSLLKNIVLAEETFYNDESHYRPCTGASCNEVYPGLNSSDVWIQIDVSRDGQSFELRAAHKSLSEGLAYNSEVGRIQRAPNSTWDSLTSSNNINKVGRRK